MTVCPGGLELLATELESVPLPRVGASLTLVTVMLDVAVAVLNAVAAPFDAVVTLVPVLPLVWSQARNVTDAVVPFCALGTSRNKSVDLRSKALALLTAPTAVHVVPPLIEYCQVPVPATTVVTAMPCKAPGSVSEN